MNKSMHGPQTKPGPSPVQQMTKYMYLMRWCYGPWPVGKAIPKDSIHPIPTSTSLEHLAPQHLSTSQVAINGYLWCLWKLSRRQDWGSVYLENEEPYAPIQDAEHIRHT